MGTATVSDQCTTVGSILTSPIITIPPGGLSTLRPEAGLYYANEPGGRDNFTVGEVWSDPTGQGINPQDIKPLNIRDLACPTWGLGLSTSANGDIITTVGPPWLPLILPPIEIFSLDSKWASECTGFWSDLWTLNTLFLFDPPIALTPAALLAPTPPAHPMPADPTTVSERPSNSAEAAKPASLPSDPAASPTKTGDPGKDSPSQSAADPASPPDSSAASLNDKANPLPDPKIFSDPASPGDPPAESNTRSSSTPNPPLGDSQKPPPDPEVSIVSGSPQEGISATHTQGLGAIIYNAFGKSEPGVGELSTVLLSPQSIFTIGTQVFTANPTGFNVNNAAISPGGTAHEVDGTLVSLGQSGGFVIGSSTISLTDPISTPVLAVAGQTFTPNPSAFSIAGTTISADGPAVTISGTIISLGPNGALAIGSSTVDISTLSYTPRKAYTVAGQLFTPNPSAFSIAGTSISAGGPAVTLDGTTVSLDQSGELAIGSSTIDLFPSKIYTVAGQTFTPNPSFFAIAGTTISAGGAAATINGTIISLQPSGTLLVGSSTIPLSISQFQPNINIDGFDIKAQSSFIVVDGATVSPAAAGVTISGTMVSLEAGGKTLDIGTGRFAMPTTTAGAVGGEVDVQAFTGGLGREVEVSLIFSLMCAVCGMFMLLMLM